jgi:predicted HTH domain antitoxin
MDAPSTIKVKVEMPPGLVADEDVAQLGVELRRLWAVERVRRRRLGVDRAAEVAGIPCAAFMGLLGEHGVPVVL